MRPSGVQGSDKLARGIYGARHVSFVDWLVPRIETLLRLSCTPPIKPSTLLLIFLLFAENTLSKRVRHLSEISPFNSFTTNSHPLTLFLGKWFHPFNLLFFRFYSPYGKNLSFLYPSPPFFILNLSVLGFVTTYRQCLVRQVTSRSFATGRVTRNGTRWVVEIQTN